MALLPAALVMLTSFLKIAVVLSIARSALGVPQVPPTSAVTGLALVLTVLTPFSGAWRTRASPTPRSSTMCDGTSRSSSSRTRTSA